ncbi:flagellar motor switch protein FliM [Sphingomonas sp. S1-29]|uniref:flagellar motor switch protein FliM n=1 Tax=Sphingomonas sp. S1-29 TaxID=2991074 RepID=UPI00223FEDF3|nr:flagellar motor switch protein FliM [Sphingomonas sp. S1-29]UZK68879.1 flagellar motor switch protein FliM [Sphingomonas sp. S1-29]
MVNGSAGTAAFDRRERPRHDAAHAASLGIANLNPFGDLHTLQHLSARMARSMRGVFEPVLRRAVRTWVEPLSVERFGSYCAERPKGMTVWLPLAMQTPSQANPGQALMAIDAKFSLELLDLFFGGTGEAPHPMPSELSPAAEAMVQRIGTMIAEPLAAAWEPVARLSFAPGHPETSCSMLANLDDDDAMIVTRFGIAAGNDKPVFVDLVYPVAALKPIGPSLNAKVHGRTAEPEPHWRTGLTRAAMAVTFPVRSVLAEPTISLGRLLELKEGDVIPISFGQHVPVMIGTHRLGTGIVGSANGHAAICLHSIERLDEEDYS